MHNKYKQLHHIHDHFFKKSMSDVRVAKDFFELYLPEDVKQYMDFSQLELQKESYIDDELKSAAADVVYKTVFRDTSGYLYVLVEHQSNVDHLLPFRIFKYMLKIMQQHVEQTQSNILPIVYPLVFYTGETSYTGSNDVFELFGDHEDLARQIWLQSVQLIDMNKVSDDALKEHLWAGIMGFVYKYRAIQVVKDFEKTIGLWIRELEQQEGFDYILNIVKYIFHTKAAERPQEFIEKLKPHLADALGETHMQTIAEYLRQEGRQEGEYLLLLRLLKCKFKSIPDSYEQKLKQADAETLLKWGERILQAQTLEEIFKKSES